MKRLLQLAQVIPFFLLAACGGSKTSTTPPVVAGLDPQTVQTLQALSQNAIDACCSGATPFLQNYSMYMSNQSTGSSLQAPNMSACQTAISNFNGEFTTALNGQYANMPVAQSWLQQQQKAAVNCASSNAGITMANVGNYMPAISVLQNQFASQLNSLGGSGSSNPWTSTTQYTSALTGANQVNPYANTNSNSLVGNSQYLAPGVFSSLPTIPATTTSSSTGNSLTINPFTNNI